MHSYTPDELRELIAQALRDLENNEDGLVRELCRLAVRGKVDAESYRDLLVDAGLRVERASEIKQVLLRPNILNQFLNGYPWKKALAEARQESPKAAERAARRLVGLLFRRGQQWDPASPQVTAWRLQWDRKHQFKLTGPDGTLEVLVVMLPVQSQPSI
jgi:hypothetical protein